MILEIGWSLKLQIQIYLIYCKYQLEIEIRYIIQS